MFSGIKSDFQFFSVQVLMIVIMSKNLMLNELRHNEEMRAAKDLKVTKNKIKIYDCLELHVTCIIRTRQKCLDYKGVLIINVS